jgi:hypothetical protein
MDRTLGQVAMGESGRLPSGSPISEILSILLILSKCRFVSFVENSGPRQAAQQKSTVSIQPAAAMAARISSRAPAWPTAAMPNAWPRS